MTARPPVFSLAQISRVLPALLSVFALCLVPSTAQADGVTFLSPAGYQLASSSNPVNIAVGDVNGDGKVDLVASDNGSGNVSVLLGNGDGTFAAANDFPVGGAPGAIATGDFTGDGKPDVAVLSLGSPYGVSILPGHGDGSFGTALATSPSLGSWGIDMATGDLNGDGRPDIVAVTAGSSGNVQTFLSNGNGTFTAKPALTAAAASSVALGDVNRDHKLDLVVGTSSGLVVFLGNGDGTFGAAHGYVSGTQISAVALGDFTGNGVLDAGVVRTTTPAVGISLGGGDGAFGGPAFQTVPSSYSALAAGDLFSNGRPELVATTHSGNKLSVFANPGDGTIGSEQDLTVTNPLSVTVADVNGDGNPDLIVPSGSANKVMVYLSTPPTATLSSGALTFPGAQVGTTAAGQTVTLTNTAASSQLPDVSVSSVTLSGADPQDFAVSNGCGSPVLAGQACPLTVSFTPTAAGARTATLTVTDNASGRTQTVTLYGTGAAPTPPSTGGSGGTHPLVVSCHASAGKVTGKVLRHRRLQISETCTGRARVAVQLLALVPAAKNRRHHGHGTAKPRTVVLGQVTLSFARAASLRANVRIPVRAERQLPKAAHVIYELRVAVGRAVTIVRLPAR